MAKPSVTKWGNFFPALVGDKNPFFEEIVFLKGLKILQFETSDYRGSLLFEIKIKVMKFLKNYVK